MKGPALTGAGREDLARRVRWVSEEDGDGAGYDISSFEPNGRSRLIEVKTTNGWERTPFFISRNEVAVSQERSSEWCLFRLWNFSREPKAFEISPSSRRPSVADCYSVPGGLPQGARPEPPGSSLGFGIGPPGFESRSPCHLEIQPVRFWSWTPEALPAGPRGLIVTNAWQRWRRCPGGGSGSWRSWPCTPGRWPE